MGDDSIAEDELLRKERIISDAIEEFDLDLSGQTVFTELGSNDYLFTPVIASLAGADQVYAITEDSKYGTVDALTSELAQVREYFGLDDNIEVVERKQESNIGSADIVTNSGFVRPIDQETIDLMKPTAVIPLMWETWEFREDELNLDYARENNVLVLGTNEYFLYENNGFLVTKLLFELGLGVYKDNILILASGRIRESISDFFTSLDVDHAILTLDEDLDPTERANHVGVDEARAQLDQFDAIVVAEHYHDTELLSEDGLIPPSLVKERNPIMKVAHICGSIDEDAVTNAGLELHPRPTAPFGHMTVSAAHLDSHAVLELNTAGLRVGEIMSRLRSRFSLEEAYERAIDHELVDDFPGGYLPSRHQKSQ
ncbi:hypothetical protein [Halosimplex marinum]|uniref:hypothetical protein n=1 Tax=Halosimplex marinum TaxID=3396620 RepID=UPI003F54F7E2